MNKLIFLLSLIALLVGCQSRQVEYGQGGYDYDPSVTGGPVEPAAPTPPVTSRQEPDVVFVETDDPAMLQTPATPAPARTYTVKKGDTYYGIAARELGSGKRAAELAAMNPQYPEDRLPIGAVITLP